METIRTICVDFDGVIVHYDTFKGRGIFGELIIGAKEALIELKNNGITLIIFTTRGEEDIIESFLNQHRIPFDYINMNPSQPYGTNRGKPFADIYIDDRG